MFLATVLQPSTFFSLRASRLAGALFDGPAGPTTRQDDGGASRAQAQTPLPARLPAGGLHKLHAGALIAYVVSCQSPGNQFPLLCTAERRGAPSLECLGQASDGAGATCGHVCCTSTQTSCPVCPFQAHKLCSTQVFRSRIGSLRKGLKSRVEFVFLDAPFLAEAADADELRETGGGEAGRSW